MDYVKRSGNPEYIDERSMSMESEHLDEVIQAVTKMRESGRYDIGIALGVIRALRDAELLDMNKFQS